MLAAQLTRFASIGAVATLVHVTVALMVSGMGFAAQAANLAGFAAAVMLSYFGHGAWVFKANLRHSFHGPRFVATALVGLIVSSSLTHVIATTLGAPFVVAMAVVAVAVPVSTYLLCRFWVFKPAY